MTTLERAAKARHFFAQFDAQEAPQSLEQEASEPVPPYRRALSASALKTFIECERKWFFRYLCGVVEDPGSAAGTYGTAFHEALEYFHQRYLQPTASQADEMAGYLQQLITTAFRKYAASLGSPLEAELQLRRAKRTAQRYLEWLLKRVASDPFEVIGNETHAPLELDGQTFTGYIDRIDRSERDGSVIIIDYKTGSIAQTAGEYADEVAALKEFQLPLYYWSRTAQGERVSRIMLIPLKDAQRDIAPIELDIVAGLGTATGRSTRGTLGIEDLKRGRKRMGELATQFTKAPLSTFATTSDPDACHYCAYRAACRHKPGKSQDPFGR